MLQMAHTALHFGVLQIVGFAHFIEMFGFYCLNHVHATHVMYYVLFVAYMPN